MIVMAMMTMTSPIFLSIDAGTEGVRVGLIDSQGHLLAHTTRPYATYFPQPGWAEQQPDDWWSALVEALRECVLSAPAIAQQIAGICFDATTCTLLALDAAGSPIRPALMWMDVRAAAQAQRIHATQHPVLQYSPSGLAAEWMVCKALWLREHEPQTYARTRHLIEFTDWLAYKLTGRLVLNLNTATQRWHYNSREWRWPTDLFAALGMPDLVEKFPSEIVPLGAPLGGLLPEVAQAIGLPALAGVPVFEGAGDAFIALPGMNVTQPGAIGLITGSSNVMCGFFERELHLPGLFGGFPDAIMPGLWLLEAGQVSTGSVLAWFGHNFARELPSDLAYKILDAEAAQVPMGAEGVIALEHFQGNRTPYTDSRSRGAVWGLSLASTRGHVFRALMEGIAYGTRQILEIMQQAGGVPHVILACGGATRSATFMQLYADICGLPLSVLTVPDAPLLGGAIAAAVGAGVYPNMTNAAQAMTQVAVTYDPDMAQHAQSQTYFAQYKATYGCLRPLLHGR